MESFVAQVVETGERQPLGVHRLLAEDVFWSLNGGPGVPREPATLRVAQGGKLFRWSWTDGWRQMASGQPVAMTNRHIVLDTCDDLSSCRRVLLDGDGAVVADLSDQPSLASTTVASSAAGRFAHVGFASLSMRIVDERGEISSYQLPLNAVDSVAWIGEEHVLLWGEVGAPLLLEAETGTVSELTFLERAAGTQPEFVWLPDLAG